LEFIQDKIINNKFNSVKDSYEKHKKKVHFNDNEIQDEFKDTLETLLNKNTPENIYTHISSPAPDEELIFPLTLSHKNTTKHSKKHSSKHSVRHHKKPITHITYKVNRKVKTNTHSSNSKTLKNKNKSHRHTISRRTF
jgi:hypothetical protein